MEEAGAMKDKNDELQVELSKSKEEIIAEFQKSAAYDEALADAGAPEVGIRFSSTAKGSMILRGIFLSFLYAYPGFLYLDVYTAPPPEASNFPNVGLGHMGGFIPMATARFGNFAFSAGFGGLFPSIFNIQGLQKYPAKVISRRVLVDEGTRQVVDLEQEALWKFLWWSGTIPVHVLGDQNREDHSMKFKQVKTGYMKRFEGCWKVEPVLVLIVLKSKLYLRNYLTNAMLMNQFESRKDKRFSVDTGGTNSRESGNQRPASVLRNEVFISELAEARYKYLFSCVFITVTIYKHFAGNNDSIENGKIPSDMNDFLGDANIDNMLSVEKAEVELPEEGKNLTETVKACEVNTVSEDDYIDLGKAGLGSCLLGGLPDWLIAYSA
ncbi:hypothetical protein POM88_021907 [Heracleum sosnowskyi]|uniref:Uncharacterized protein n=1 Tax=Heracleum sosnowskyi TaxID=360622 RepID=A0AAD8IE11_9APIA|nr:hypothetical protein POM88_021907 [Heracleum sosnowskyi]